MRLTKKQRFTPFNNYELNFELNNGKLSPTGTQQDILNKLGQSEDILEEHKIETLEELNSLLSYAKQIKDIEKELGIDLITLFKALSQGVFLENGTKGVEHHPVFLCVFNGKWALGYEYSRKYGLQGWVLETEKYKKHWALTKEELL